MGLLADLKAIVRKFERDATDLITRYGSGNFGSIPLVLAIQDTTAAYCVFVSSNSVNAHLITLTPRAQGAGVVTIGLAAGGISNVPTAPWSEITVDAADANLYYFFSDVPLLLGGTGVGVP